MALGTDTSEPVGIVRDSGVGRDNSPDAANKYAIPLIASELDIVPGQPSRISSPTLSS